MSIAENLAAVRARIADAARAAGREPGAVTLVAVSKTHPAEAVGEAVAAGQMLFGENRVQEAAAKFPALRAAHPALRLHLIGPLQTNKARDAVRLFDRIESLDRPKLADALAAAIAAAGMPTAANPTAGIPTAAPATTATGTAAIPTAATAPAAPVAAAAAKQHLAPDCLIQVNTGREPQKAGCLPEEVDALLAHARALGLTVSGLMCIPPAEEDPAPHFAMLAEMARRLGLPVLSMGMSGDYAAAVAAGATHVRVGSAVFGSRS